MMALVLGFPQMCLKMLGLHGENEKILQNASYKWSYKGNIHTVARPNLKTIYYGVFHPPLQLC